MITVCHMSTAHNASDIRIVRKECRSAAEAGFDAVAVIKGVMPDDCRHVRHVQVTAPRRNRLYRFVFNAANVYRLARRERAAIYHFHDPDLLPHALLLRLRGAKVIYDVHEDVPRDILSKEWIPRFARRPIALLFEQFENLSTARMTAVVAATPHIAQRMSRLNPRTISVNNYPFTNELMIAESDAERRDIGSGFCYVGGISSIRGADQMLDAARISGLRLSLAGPIETQSLERRMRAHPAWSSVEYLGTLDRPRVAGLMARSTAGLVLFHPEPNHVNAQPNKLFEYMSAGLPVIASDFPLWRDIVERYECGICVDPLDPEAIARAMRLLAENQELSNRFGRNGRDAVLHHFNWENEKDKLLALYRTVASGAA